MAAVALGEALPLSGLLSRQYDLGHQREYPGAPPLHRGVTSGKWRKGLLPQFLICKTEAIIVPTLVVYCKDSVLYKPT